MPACPYAFVDDPFSSAPIGTVHRCVGAGPQLTAWGEGPGKSPPSRFEGSGVFQAMLTRSKCSDFEEGVKHFSNIYQTLNKLCPSLRPLSQCPARRWGSFGGGV